MPLLDLSLPELRRYRGRNPRPADFDAYWTRALAELDATAPGAELIPCPAAGPEAHDLRFTGVGGAGLHAKYLRPAGPGPHPIVLLFHGYGAGSGDWFDKLAWVQRGFCVAALDCRGQGGRSDDNGVVRGTTLRGHFTRGLDDPDPRRLLFRQVFLDTVQLFRVVAARPEVDAGRAGCLGSSQGGALALACAALEPRIRRAVAIHPFLCDYRRVWEMDLARDAYEELRYFFRNFDPRHEQAEAIFTRLGYIDVQHLAPRIRAEVLMVTGLMDSICPPSTQFAAYNAITAPKDVVLYPDFGHETMPGCLDRAGAFLGVLAKGEGMS